MQSTHYSNIPQTGGQNKSPIRDDLTALIRLYIDGEDIVIDGKAENLVEFYRDLPRKPWTIHHLDTINMLKCSSVVKTSECDFQSIPTAVNLKLVDFVGNYLESYGLEGSSDYWNEVKDVISEYDLFHYEEFQCYVTLQTLIGRIENIKSHGLLKGYYECKDSFVNGEIRVFEHFAIIDWKDSRSIFPYNSLLSVRDALLKRSIALLASQSDSIILGSEYPSTETVRSIFNWGECVLRRKGNEGYTVISTLESLLTGIIIKKHDDFDNSEFFEFCKGKIKSDDDDEVNNATDYMINQIEKSDTKEMLVQCFALFKVWSFPIVNETKAMETLIEYGRNEKVYSYEAMDYQDALLRRNFFLSHLGLTNTKPKNAIYIGSREDHVYDVVMKGEKFNSDHDDYDVLQWSNLQMRGSIEPIFNADIGSYMKDKSISPELHKLWTVYNKSYVSDDEEY